MRRGERGRRRRKRAGQNERDDPVGEKARREMKGIRKDESRTD